MKALEIKGISKRYKNDRGISDISLEINQGDIYGLLGPNGSGKTTTMKIVTGLIHKDSGEVFVYGNNIDGNIKECLKDIGCLIENPAVYEYLSAEKNLRIAAKYCGDIPEERIKDVLQQTGLMKYQNQKKKDIVKNYSLGMKQRLGIALALISKPKLVILDEPANGLDIEGMVEIRNIIKREAEINGTTFLISSHLAHELELMCNRVSIMHEGKLIDSDSMDNIIDKYTTLENYYIRHIDKERGNL